MGQSRPFLIISTSHRPSPESRSLCKLLNHIIPSSKYLKRGNLNEASLFHACTEFGSKYLMIISSKGNKAAKVEIMVIEGLTVNKIPEILKIYQYIDHKIYGWQRLPSRGPLSISQEASSIDPTLIDYFIKFFGLVVGKKRNLWLMIDVSGSKRYLQFVDAVSKLPIAYLQVKLEK